MLKRFFTKLFAATIYKEMNPVTDTRLFSLYIFINFYKNSKYVIYLYI